MRRLAELMILPPSSALLLLLVGTAVRRRWRRTGLGLQIAGLAWLWLASTPLFAGLLLHSLQTSPALPPEGPLPDAQAIVVLAAAADTVGSEYGGPVIGAMTMQRVRYAAFLHRRTGLPVLVSGGKPASTAAPLAVLMQHALEQEFSVPVRWVEDRSADTWENAAFSAEMLQRDGIARILLVTTAWHLPRAMPCFERQGLEVVPAPTAFRGDAYQNFTSLLPHWQALRDTSYGMHEWLGRLYYATLR